jgi:lysostaphin
VIRVSSDQVESARLGDHTIRLFKAGSKADKGTGGASAKTLAMGLMPVPVLTKPGIYALEFLDASGAVMHQTRITVLNAHYARQNIAIEPSIANLQPSPGEREAVAAFRKLTTETRFWSEPLRLPVPGCMTSPFGVQRYHNGKPTGDFHAGLDQRGAVGTKVRAIAGGTVKISRQFNLRGGTIGVDHGQGLESIYMHMSKLVAKEGDRVSAGDVIGEVGSTGRSTGAHLHWSLYVDGEPVNPRQWVHVDGCAPRATKQ